MYWKQIGGPARFWLNFSKCGPHSHPYSSSQSRALEMNNKSFGKLLSALIKFHHSIWGQSPSFWDTDLLNPSDYNQHFLCISQHAFAATCSFTLGIIVTPSCCKSFFSASTLLHWKYTKRPDNYSIYFYSQNIS